MDRILSAKEIGRRYDGEWVFLADPIMDAAGNLLRGKVLFHGLDSDRIYQKAFALKDKPRRSAMLWIGARPQEPVLVL